MRDVIRIVVSLFGVYIILKSWSEYKAKKESWIMLIFWTFIWLTVIVFAFFPSIVDYILGKFGTSKVGIGTFLGIGMVVLLFISYRLYIKSERIERQMTKLVQDLALKDLPRKKDNKKN